METSILTSTKKILGLDSEYTAFDLDVITDINSAFASLHQLGVGPEYGFYIEDAEAEWEDYPIPQSQLSMVKTYVFLKVRSMFDPPTMSFLVEAMNNQIKEHEWRLNVFREGAMNGVPGFPGDPSAPPIYNDVIDGGDPNPN